MSFNNYCIVSIISDTLSIKNIKPLNRYLNNFSIGADIPRIESLTGNNIFPVGLEEFPFTAFFENYPEGDFLCGGALISKKHVLTLTRCIEGRNLQSFRILFNGAHAQDPVLTYTADSMITYSSWAQINHLGSIVQHMHSMAIVTVSFEQPSYNSLFLAEDSQIFDRFSSVIRYILTANRQS